MSCYLLGVPFSDRVCCVPMMVFITVSIVLRGPDGAVLDRAHAEIMQIMRELGGNPVEEDPEKAQASAEPED